jgi:hypothetical protein
MEKHATDPVGPSREMTRLEELGFKARKIEAEMFAEVQKMNPAAAGALAYGGEAQPNRAGRPGPERITLENVDEAMRYHPWGREQLEAGEQCREALTAAIKTILRTVPESPLRTRAINKIVDARMIANAAITFRGRF